MRIRLTALLLGASLAACDITEVETTASQDLLIVEGLVRITPNPASSQVQVFVHRTVQGAQGQNAPVPDAQVQLTLGSGQVQTLARRPREECAIQLPIEGDGTCFIVGFPAEAGFIDPGDRLQLRVSTPAGEEVQGFATIPGAFDFITPSGGVAECSLPPNTILEMAWTSSEGTWAYLNETAIFGLDEAFGARGIEAPSRLDLLGLSVSSADTTVAFPSQFGIFDRFDLDQDLAVALQEGLPAEVNAAIVISAVDRNFVNWVRGGNFNPSGVVRVPSMQGDGSGFFGVALARSVRISTLAADVERFPSCS